MKPTKKLLAVLVAVAMIFGNYIFAAPALAASYSNPQQEFGNWPTTLGGFYGIKYQDTGNHYDFSVSGSATVYSWDGSNTVAQGTLDNYSNVTLRYISVKAGNNWFLYDATQVDANGHCIQVSGETVNDGEPYFFVTVSGYHITIDLHGPESGGYGISHVAMFFSGDICGFARFSKAVSNVEGDGTVFTLAINKDGSPYTTVNVSEAGGAVTIPLPYGNYTVSENTATGYRNDNVTPSSFSIGSANITVPVTVTANNTKLYGSIIVNKVFSPNTAEHHLLTFELYKNDVDTGISRTIDWPEQNSCTFGNLDVGATYKVYETNVPFGYSSDFASGSAPITISNETPVPVLCTNTQLRGSIVVTKAFSGATPAPGAAFVFDLYQGAAKIGLSQPIVWPNTQTTFADLPYGDYTVYEQDATGLGYSTQASFRVGAGEAVRLDSPSKEVTCTNTQLLGKVSVEKSVNNATDDDTVFSVRIQGANPGNTFDHTVSVSEHGGIVNGSTPGYEFLNSLPFGTYAVTEASNSNYEKVGKIYINGIEQLSDQFTIGSNNYASMIAIKVVNRQLQGRIVVTKHLTGGVVDANATFSFTLHCPDGSTKHAGPIHAGESCSFDGLPLGAYTLYEDAAFGFDATPVFSGAISGHTVYLTTEDTRYVDCYNTKLYGSITVTKGFTNADYPADGTPFTFALWENGAQVRPEQTIYWAAGGVNSVTFTGLEYGHTYVVKETARAGFISASGDVSVYVDSANETVNYSNTKQNGGFSISKALDSVDGDHTLFHFTLTGPSYPAGYGFDLESGQAKNFPDVLYGTYTLVETAVPGYELTNISGGGGTLAGGVYTFALSGSNQNFAVTADNCKLGSLAITKAMLDGITVTPGFDFTITGPGYDHVPFTLQLTANPATATRTFENLAYGSYTITELPKAGYALAGFTCATGSASGNSYTVTVGTGANRDIQITATNRALGRLELTKKSSYDNSLLGGAVFQVTSAADPAVSFQLTTSNVTDATHEKGKAVSGWLVPGDYYVQEITAPDGYEIDDKAVHTVKVEPGMTTSGVDGTVYTDSLGKVLVQKYSSYGRKGIGGVRFQLLSAPPDANGNALPGSILDEQATDPSGLAVFNHLFIGRHYWVREIQQAPHYDIDRLLVFEVTASFDPKAPAAEFINNPLGRVSLLKYDASTVIDGDYEHATMVGGATFGIYDNAACTGAPIATLTSSATGAVESVDLPFSSALSTYYVKELAPAPAGYQLNETPQPATFTEPGQVVQLRFTNIPDIGALVIKKIDALTKAPLADAEFTLYTDKAMLHPVGLPVTTGADGIARFDNLEPGTYWIMETKAPADYDKMTEPLDVTVTAGVTNPGPIEISDQYNPPDPYHTGTMDWNFIILGGLAVFGGLLLMAVTRKRRARSK